MKKSFGIICSLSTGLILSLPWLFNLSGLFLLVAFVPMLWMERFEKSSSFIQFTFQVFGAIVVWNCLATWWIVNASLLGAITAVLVNSSLLSLVFVLFHITRERIGDLLGYLSLIVYQTAFEYVYLNAEVSWPWLNLGNGMASSYPLVQWYEYVGVLGGTVWIMVANVCVFYVFKSLYAGDVKLQGKCLLIALVWIVFPCGWSMFRYNSYQEMSNPCGVVLVQPAFDSYDTKTSTMAKCSRLIKLVDEVMNDSVCYIVAPEAFLQDEVREPEIRSKYSLPILRRYVSTHPHSGLVIGAVTYREDKQMCQNFAGQEHSRESLIKCNTALHIMSGDSVQIYHKSKLVVGVEKIPYAQVWRFFRKVLGFTPTIETGYRPQDERTVFFSERHKAIVAPVICYESVYGQFVSGFVKNGANVVFVLTNDGWWGDEAPVYGTLLDYARLRAIETRRCVARAASTGISAIINQRGDVIQSIPQGASRAIRGDVNLNDAETAYVKYGDLCGLISVMISVFLLVILGVKSVFKSSDATLEKRSCLSK